MKLPYKRRAWTPQELDGLIALAEQFSPTVIAERYHRTTVAIEVKLKKLKISKKIRSGWFTEEEVCQILGVETKWLKSRSDLGFIKMQPHNPDKPPRKGMSCPWHISEKGLRDFIIKYPSELDGKKVNMVMIVDILLGRPIEIKEREELHHGSMDRHAGYTGSDNCPQKGRPHTRNRTSN